MPDGGTNTRPPDPSRAPTRGRGLRTLLGETPDGDPWPLASSPLPPLPLPDPTAGPDGPRPFRSAVPLKAFQVKAPPRPAPSPSLAPPLVPPEPPPFVPSSEAAPEENPKPPETEAEPDDATEIDRETPPAVPYLRILTPPPQMSSARRVENRLPEPAPRIDLPDDASETLPLPPNAQEEETTLPLASAPPPIEAPFDETADLEDDAERFLTARTLGLMALAMVTATVAALAAAGRFS